MDTVDQRAHRIGRTQHGLATRRQLLVDAGISPSSVSRRLRAGIWTEPLPNVIDLGTHRPSWRGNACTLLLAAGPSAWISHDTAAYLHGFLDAPRPRLLDVVVPRGRHPQIRDLRLHTVRALGADEVTQVAGLACTTPARTLLDLASRTIPDVLERYLADAERRAPGTVRQLVALTDRHRRLPGRRRALDIVQRLPDGVARLGSPLEVLGVQRLRHLGAPRFVVQHAVRDRNGARIKRVDVAWPERRTVLEFDGAAYHDLVAVRADDQAARSRMRACGWRVEVARRSDLHSSDFASFVDSLRG